MHCHGTKETARSCSRFCAANFDAAAYYHRHRHGQETAPAAGCLACEDDRQRTEAKQREGRTVRPGFENPLHENCHLRAGMTRVPSR
jgi:hypothetical protein